MRSSNFVPRVVVSLLLFGCFNILSIPLLSSASRGGSLLWSGFIGVIAAEFGLVAAWGVFSSARLVHRIQICAGIGLGLYACLILGILTVDTTGIRPFKVVLMPLVMAPLVFSTVQLPLWGFRGWLGWEVAKTGQPPRGSYQQPMGIKHLVLGTAALSVALSIARLGSRDTSSSDTNLAMLGVATFAASAGLVSLATMPPLLFFVLGTSRISMRLLGIGIWFLAGLVLLTLPSLLYGRGLSPDALSSVVMLIGSFAGVTAFALHLVRVDGYQLRWGRTDEKPNTQVPNDERSGDLRS